MMAKQVFRRFRHHLWFLVLGGFLLWLLLIHLFSMDAIKVEGGIRFTLSRYDQAKDNSFYVNSGPNYAAENSSGIVGEGVSGATNSDIFDAKKVVDVQENDFSSTKKVENEKKADAQENDLSSTRNVEFEKTVDVGGTNFSKTRNSENEKFVDIQENDSSATQNVESEKLIDDQENDLSATRNVEVEKIIDAQGDKLSRTRSKDNEKTMDVQENDSSTSQNLEVEKTMDVQRKDFSDTKKEKNGKMVDVQENDPIAAQNSEVEKIVDANEDTFSNTKKIEKEKMVDDQEDDSTATRNAEAKRTVRVPKERFPNSRNAGNVKRVDVQKNAPPTTRNLDLSSSNHPVSETREDKPNEKNQEIANFVKDPCAGRYIHILTLPRQFHRDLLRDCKTLAPWTDMCQVLSNLGLGPQIDPDKTLSNTGWYNTNQFSLEVIFHNRMKQYKCLTNDSSVASAIFLPYYAGLDVARFLWMDPNRGWRDAGPSDLVKWLRRRPEWRRMHGKDHFLVAGRIVWDFRRENEEGENWGNNLAILPETQGMSILVLESSLIPDSNDFAIPYPTYFHPSMDDDVFKWQEKVRNLRRPYLYTFAGAPRPHQERSIRGEIINQCKASGRKCFFLECHDKGNKCHVPAVLMRTFQNAAFCLQPQGDSYTRRSAFDSILAGCIPVFFHPGSFYEQYKWHIPSNYTKYSAFIPEKDVKDGKVSIERVLLRIPRDRVLAMREEVIKLIPNLIYANPNSELETLEDAFDLTIKGVLERIERFRTERFGS